MNVYRHPLIVRQNAAWKEAFFVRVGAVRRAKLRKLFDEQDGKCCYCGCQMVMGTQGRRQATLEHIIPQAHGGTDHPLNLMAACCACNTRRGSALTAMEFFMLRNDPVLWADKNKVREKSKAARKVFGERDLRQVLALAFMMYLCPEYAVQVDESLVCAG